MHKSPITGLLEYKNDNFVKRVGNSVSVKQAFILNVHMILTHFYHCSNFAFWVGDSLHLYGNIKSTR